MFNVECSMFNVFSGHSTFNIASSTVTTQPPPPANPERARMSGAPHDVARWRKWGPYLADRAWGTVREDYSADGEAWAWFPHDQARSRAYRWGEDGIAG